MKARLEGMLLSMLIVAALAAVAGCVTPSQADEGPPDAGGGTGTSPRAPPVSWEAAGCQAFVGGFVVPAGPVRAEVPAEYHILGEETGHVTLVAAVNACATMGVDGEAGQQGTISEVAVPIASPDGTGGVHQYMLWMSTNNPTIHDAWAALEIPSELGAETLDVGTGLPGGAASAAAAYDGTYELRGMALTPGTPFIMPATYWHDGPTGRAIIVCAFEGGVLGTAEATVDAEEGSTLARLLSGTTATGGGPLVTGFGWSAQITFG